MDQINIFIIVFCNSVLKQKISPNINLTHGFFRFDLNPPSFFSIVFKIALLLMYFCQDEIVREVNENPNAGWKAAFNDRFSNATVSFIITSMISSFQSYRVFLSSREANAYHCS